MTCNCTKKSPIPKDFCSSLSLQTPVTLSEQGGNLSVLVSTPAGVMELRDAMATNRCQITTTGTRLAQIVTTLQAQPHLRRTGLSLGRTLTLDAVRRQLEDAAKTS